MSTGQKLTRLRGSGGGGGGESGGGTKTHHRRMVSAVCWATSTSSSSAALATGGGDLSSEAVMGSGGPPPGSSEWRCRANLFSAGFDRKAFGWSVRYEYTFHSHLHSPRLPSCVVSLTVMGQWPLKQLHNIFTVIVSKIVFFLRSPSSSSKDDSKGGKDGGTM